MRTLTDRSNRCARRVVPGVLVLLGCLATVRAQAPPLELKVSFLDARNMTWRNDPRPLAYGRDDFVIVRARWNSEFTKDDKVSYRAWLSSDQRDWASANTPATTDANNQTECRQFAYISPLYANVTRSVQFRLDGGYRAAGKPGHASPLTWPGFPPATGSEAEGKQQSLPPALPLKPGTYRFVLHVQRLSPDAEPVLASQPFEVQIKGSADDIAVCGISDEQIYQRRSKTHGDLTFTVVCPAAGQSITTSVLRDGKAISTCEQVSAAGTQVVTIGDVPVGGPYQVQVSVADQKQTFDHIYVGDLWVISGQSNAVGVGYDQSQGAKPMPGVHGLSPKYGLHMWKPAADGFFESTVGPWVLAAQKFHRETGVPVGLMGHAVGSRPIDYFIDAQTGDMPYLHPLIEARGRGAAAFFWYQGESDAFNQERTKAYGAKLDALAKAVRACTHNPQLMIGVVQIGRYGWHRDDHFAGIREAQRQFVLRDPRSILLSTLPYAVNDSDKIHLVTEGYVALAQQIGAAMIAQEKTGRIATPGPTVERVRFAARDHRQIIVTFAHAQGLTGGDATEQWYVTDQSRRGFREGGFVPVQKVAVDADKGQVVLDLAEPAQEAAAVSYGYRCDVGGTLGNDGGFAAPAFVGMPVQKE
ncbi:MAG: sialate O-acetylesterase [Phycisphaeraceae bacterium]